MKLNVATTIWKFPLNAKELNEIQMPKGAEILCCQNQNEQPYIWARVDPGLEAETRYFRVVGTGHTIYPDEELKYISTFQLKGGKLVFHLFEKLG
jgi:hypothetical protein